MGKSRPGIVPISIFGALLLPAACLAQRYTFKQYGQAEGLSNLNVNVLFQNRAGVLWAGTENGLFRFDGLRFERVSLGSSVLAGDIFALDEDAGGRLWVGRQNGVGYIVRGVFHEVSFQDKKLRLFAGSTISFASDGTVYIASDGDLLAGKRSRSSGEFDFHPIAVRDPAAPGLPLTIHSVLARSDGSLLAGCGEGICRIDGSRLQRWGEKEGVQKDDWQGLHVTSKGEIWALGAKHIAALRPGETVFQNRGLSEIQNPDSLNSITEDLEGRVLTSNGKQLLRWENGAWTTLDERQGIGPYGIGPVFVSMAGEVWFAPSGHGLSRWLGYNNWENWTTAEGLQSDTIWAILRDRTGRLWVGNDNGLAFLDRGAKKFTPWTLPGLPKGQRVSGLAESKDGAVWVGTGSNVVRIDPTTLLQTRVTCPASIIMIREDSHNRLWVGTRDGLYVVNTALPPGARFEASRSLPAWTSHVTEGPDQQIFAYTRIGLYRLDGSVWREIEAGPGLELGGNDSPLASDAPNSLWVNQEPGVVHIGIQNGRVSHVDRYTERTLGSERAYFIERDRRGLIWLGLDSGVTFLDGTAWHILTQQDGLIWNDGDDQAFLEDKDEGIRIGTSGGL